VEYKKILKIDPMSYYISSNEWRTYDNIRQGADRLSRQGGPKNGTVFGTP